jgi:HPt (histidine-containing phosphotransfer) domain-containing protein
MDDYLSKPFKPEALAAVIKRWMSAPKSLLKSMAKDKSNQLIVEDASEGFSSQRLDELGGEFGKEMVLDVIDLFLTDTVERLAQMHSVVHDVAKLGREAHGLKGSCRNVGAERMGSLCEQLETHGRAGSALPEMLTLMTELEREWDLLKPLLEARRDRLHNGLQSDDRIVLQNI